METLADRVGDSPTAISRSLASGGIPTVLALEMPAFLPAQLEIRRQRGRENTRLRHQLLVLNRTVKTPAVRYRDGVYGAEFVRRVAAPGIQEKPTTPRAPWQNPYAEWLIGTLGPRCPDAAALGIHSERRMPVPIAFSARLHKNRSGNLGWSRCHPHGLWNEFQSNLMFKFQVLPQRHFIGGAQFEDRRWNQTV